MMQLPQENRAAYFLAEQIVEKELCVFQKQFDECRKDFKKRLQVRFVASLLTTSTKLKNVLEVLERSSPSSSIPDEQNVIKFLLRKLI
eukprot:1188865-Prorocentrum_minimum.AAC.2